jgi:hypothetical protein
VPDTWIIDASEDQPHLKGLTDSLKWWCLNLVAQPRSWYTAQYINTGDSLDSGTSSHAFMRIHR